MCTRPIEIKVVSPISHRERIVLAPCGKCHECLASYQQSWTLRMAEEAKEWKFAYFLTLTYRDDAIPYVYLRADRCTRNDFYEINRKIQEIPVTNDLLRVRSRDSFSYLNRFQPMFTKVPVVSKRHIQLFLKRVRKSIPPRSLKYFICSEYGPRTIRPHYHGIFFTNLDKYDFQRLVVNKWIDTYGNVDWTNEPIYGGSGLQGDAKNAFSYVAKYATKPSWMSSPYSLHQDYPPTFRLISKGIGRAWRDRFRNEIGMETISRIFEYQLKHNGIRPRGSYNELPSWIKRFVKNGKLVLNLESVDYLLNEKCKTYIYDKKKQRFFKVPIPRYIYEAGTKLEYFVSRCRTTGRIYPDFATSLFLNETFFKKVNVYNNESKVSYAIEVLRNQIRDALRDSEFRALQALHPSWSDTQVDLYLSEKDRCKLVERENKMFEIMQRYYNKNFTNSKF